MISTLLHTTIVAISNTNGPTTNASTATASQNYSCLELKTEYANTCDCSHTDGDSNFYIGSSQYYSCLQLKTEYANSCDCSHTDGDSNFVKSVLLEQIANGNTPAPVTPAPASNGNIDNDAANVSNTTANGNTPAPVTPAPAYDPYLCKGHKDCVDNTYCLVWVGEQVDSSACNPCSECDEKASAFWVRVSTTLATNVSLSLPVDRTGAACCPTTCGGSDDYICEANYTQCATDCYNVWRGDDECDDVCNNAACDFDNGDCTQCAIGGCLHSWRGDKQCDTLCNNAACDLDNGDCTGQTQSQTPGSRRLSERAKDKPKRNPKHKPKHKPKFKFNL